MDIEKYKKKQKEMAIIYDEIEAEYEMLRDSYVGNETPAMPYEHFKGICDFVENTPSLQDEWMRILEQITTQAGVHDHTKIDHLKIDRHINYQFYYPPLGQLVMAIDDLQDKIVHYNYLKISDALAELLKTSPVFLKKWEEFFTLTKLFADEKDIKAMGG